MPPGPPAGPPGPPPGPPPAKKRKTGLIVMLVVGLVLALSCCGGGGFAAWLYLSDDDAPEAPEITGEYRIARDLCETFDAQPYADFLGVELEIEDETYDAMEATAPDTLPYRTKCEMWEPGGSDNWLAVYGRVFVDDSAAQQEFQSAQDTYDNVDGRDPELVDVGFADQALQVPTPDFDSAVLVELLVQADNATVSVNVRMDADDDSHSAVDLGFAIAEEVLLAQAQ